jgi:outer membrane lipoprotein
MKRLSVVLILLLLVSCASVIRKDLMETGTRNPDLAALVQDPDVHRNKLFILGGIIAHTSVTPQGSEIEALYVPVNSLGRTKKASEPTGRFLAVYPKEKGVLDPLIYKRNRRITIAGVFTGTAKGMLDKMEYVFPVFTIVQIHLGKEVRYVEIYPYYDYPYWGPYWEPYWWWY